MWCTKSIKEIEKELKTNIRVGLNDKDVEIRQEEFGKNQIEERKKENIILKLLNQFKDFMIIILIISAIVSALVSYFEGTGDYFDSIIIIAIVIFNGIMGLVQEIKAEKSIEALKKMSSPVAKVKRNGKNITIKGEEIVPGDIVILETGNYVPADIRLISTNNLKIEESSLTGETEEVTKNEKEIYTNETASLADMRNMAFASTTVVKGRGEGIVINTGMNTEVGKIARMIITNDTPITPIQKKLAEVGKILGTACIVICVLIFFIGIIKDISISEMFMTAVGLAVAAIPEGLPAIVTIILSIAVTKMAKKNAIIRKLPAVETLGSSRVICSDKTGTLTENNMRVVEIIGNKSKILEYAALCCNCEVNNKKVEGEPTEVAIVKEAIKEKFYKLFPRIGEISFDSNRKLMTTVIELQNGKYRIITKGAPEILLNICEDYEENGDIKNINIEFLNRIKKKNEKMAEKALRVLGVAYLDIDIMPKEINSEFLEKNLTFLGLIGMMDPPRKGVREAVLACRRAGIKTVMITGDQVITAKSIAKDLGILRGKEKAITGKELDLISNKKLEKEIMDYSVFARVTPEHKVRIVEAFQKNGYIVAMTGDGVNDAPALKKANIGISMGLKGTDVAKNASDMILNDDNFVTIVDAVKEGRNIFDNIKKAIHFLIATNIGEIVTIFIGLLLGVKSPLLAIQLLWINLVTDSLPAIALGLEPAEKDIMNRLPRDSKKSIFADGLMGKIITEGCMIGIFTIIAFSIGNKYYGIDVARTMAFVSLGMLELVHCFNVKSEESIFKIGIWENKYLIGAFVLGMFLQLIIVFIPSLADIFSLTKLNGTQWLITVIISLAPIFIIEIQKKINEIKFGRVVYNYKFKEEN